MGDIGSAQPGKELGVLAPHQLGGHHQGDGHQQRLDELHPFLEHQLGAHARPDELPQRHAQPHAPHHLAPQGEEEQGSDVGGEVEQLGVGGGPRHAKARQGHEADGKKRPRARPEEAVIKAHAPSHQQGKRHGSEAALALRIAHPGGEVEVAGKRHQQEGEQSLQDGGIDGLHRQGADGRPDEGADDRRPDDGPLKEPLAGIKPGGGEGAETALQLVGAKHQGWRHAGGQQGRHRQESPAPGDGIDKAGDEGHPEQGDQGEQFQFHP